MRPVYCLLCTRRNWGRVVAEDAGDADACLSGMTERTSGAEIKHNLDTPKVPF